MALTALEIIVSLFVLLGLVKLIVISVNKKAWYNGAVKTVYGNPAAARVILLVLGAAVFYLLIQEISIVQIFAAMIIMASFAGLAFLSNSKEFLVFAQKIYSKKLSGWVIFITLIWLVLVIRVLYEIFLV